MTAYGTAAELRARINKTSNADDATLTAILHAATNAVDRITNHEIAGVDVFYPDAVATARYYAGSGQRYQWIDECLSVSSVAVKTSATATAYTAWAASDYLTFTGGVRFPNFNDTPYTGLLCNPNGNYSIFTYGGLGGVERYFDWTGGLGYLAEARRAAQVPTVQVTAIWGVTTTPPAEIREACLMLAARWWKRFESAMSDTLASGEMGQLLYTQPIDPDVRMLLMNSRWYRPQVAPRY